MSIDGIRYMCHRKYLSFRRIEILVDSKWVEIPMVDENGDPLEIDPWVHPDDETTAKEMEK